MARSWQGRGLGVFPAGAPITKNEGLPPAIAYSLRRNRDRLEWRVNMPGRLPFVAPVEAALGGDRHGVSLLARVSSIDGVKLDRAPLVETRHLLGPDRDLVFSPGHPLEKPASFQTSIGRVLSSQFEAKCLACHGAPTGIQCEHCHGSGEAHAKSRATIENPAKLSNAAQIERCGQCHANRRPLADPRPEDLLISNQANALRESECYIQSGQGLSCSTCHDPHRDSPAGDSRYVKACLSCHRAGATTCPADPKGDCIRCHMPARAKDSFQIVDHWIRVPPSGSPRTPVSRSQAMPKRLFLRMILVQSAGEGEEVRSQLNGSAPFFELARRYSKDASAQSGGFLGAMWLDQMEPRLAEAAARLDYGEVSSVVRTPAGYILLQRLPHDFRWQANALLVEATELKCKGQLQAAMEKNLRALETYPTLLRALLFLGISLGEQGEMGRAVACSSSRSACIPETRASNSI